jgi:hypothetical protein
MMALKIPFESARLIAESSTRCWGRKRQATNGHAKGEQKQLHLPTSRVAGVSIHFATKDFG